MSETCSIGSMSTGLYERSVGTAHACAILLLGSSGHAQRYCSNPAVTQTAAARGDLPQTGPLIVTSGIKSVGGCGFRRSVTVIRLRPTPLTFPLQPGFPDWSFSLAQKTRASTIPITPHLSSLLTSTRPRTATKDVPSNVQERSASSGTCPLTPGGWANVVPRLQPQFTLTWPRSSDPLCRGPLPRRLRPTLSPSRTEWPS